jgi:holin-like protein
MIEAITFLLVAQLIGEVVTRGLGIPVPGPVLGLLVAAAFVAWRGVGASLHDTAHGLLRNLSLLFVPAGVGIIRQAHVLAGNWLAIAAALVVSTALTLVVTVYVFVWAHRRFVKEEPEADRS